MSNHAIVPHPEKSFTYSLLDIEHYPDAKYLGQRQCLVEKSMLPYLNEKGKALMTFFQNKKNTLNYIRIVTHAVLENVYSGPCFVKFETEDIAVRVSANNRTLFGVLANENLEPLKTGEGHFQFTTTSQIIFLEKDYILTRNGSVYKVIFENWDSDSDNEVISSDTE